MLELITLNARSADLRRCLFMVHGLGEHNGNTWRNEDARFAVQCVDSEPAWFPLREKAVDLELEISDVFLLAQSDLVRSINEFLSQSTSPSVGGAPVGAGGGTPESTEGDQTPGLPEKKKHPAAVTAGCDETKYPER